MTPKELRDLDAWIAEYVMGGEWPNKSQLILNGELVFRRERGSLIAIGYPKPSFAPTTDPAAAMQVLEKCATSNAVGVQGNVEIYQEPEGGKWAVCFNAAYQDKCVEPVFAETLPLAIALFAQKLFAK